MVLVLRNQLKPLLYMAIEEENITEEVIEKI